MPRVITIMNQKGGVGKTTTTLNLGAALAVRGQRVLLIDLDPQANLTHGLGLHANGLEESVYELLLGSDAVAEKLIKPTAWERLHLIPSHIDLSGAEIELVPVMGRETRLARALAPVRERYDFILIDCLPSLSLLTVNAMVAAGEALVPLQAHPFALEGLGKLFEVVGMLREALNPVLHVSGVLVTLYDSRTNVSRETLKRLQADPRLAPHLFNVLVRMNIKIAESQKDGIPVVHFDAACAGAKAYLRLADELLEMSRSQCLASESAGKLDAREPRKPARAARSPAKPEANPAGEEDDDAPAEPSLAVRAAQGIGQAMAHPAPVIARPEPEPAGQAEASNRFPHERAAAAPAPAAPPEPRAEPAAGPLPALRDRVGEQLEPSPRPRLRLVPYHGTLPRPDPQDQTMELSDEQKQQLKTILKEQSKIAAIKECRAMTNLGLAESKQLVDGLEAELKAEGWEPARGGCMGVMLLAVALAGWLGG